MTAINGIDYTDWNELVGEIVVDVQFDIERKGRVVEGAALDRPTSVMLRTQSGRAFVLSAWEDFGNNPHMECREKVGA